MMTTEVPLRLAVLGTGPVGRAVGRSWVQAGHDVAFGSRRPDQLAALVAELGPRASAGSWREATANRDAVLLAVAYDGVPAVLDAVADLLHDAVLVDATNPMALDADGRIASTLNTTQGTWTAQRVPATRVVRAFSHVMDELLASRGRLQPLLWGMAVAGDDPSAVELVSRLVRDVGFTPVPVGRLAESYVLDPGGVLFPHLRTPADTRDTVSAARLA